MQGVGQMTGTGNPGGQTGCSLAGYGGANVNEVSEKRQGDLLETGARCGAVTPQRGGAERDACMRNAEADSRKGYPQSGFGMSETNRETGDHR